METLEPVSYEFPSHGAVAPRRFVNSGFGRNLSFYSAASFPYPFQSPSPTYNYGHAVSPHHPGPYQHYLLAGHQPINPQPVRLSSEPPLQSMPDIRPAKNAFNRGARLLPTRSEQSPTTQPSPVPPSRSCSQGRSLSSAEVEFSTEVDVLMKAIQSRPGSHSLPPLQQLTRGNHSSNDFPVGYPISLPTSPPRYRVSPQDQVSRSGKRRTYTCALPQCGKSFSQKTHLDIHMRAHTGDKPFVCKEPFCGQRFSQLGNLKTHQRRHTGEKPFSCDICQKRFAQRGNVRAHKVTHEDTKPFRCLLDDCGKKFTQLGNLKSHQNKFHSTTLRNLTAKFGQMTDADVMDPQDRGLWEYFATLYKNSNKGIKGRGKDRRITSSSSNPSPKSGSAPAQLDSQGTVDDVRMQRIVYEDESTYTASACSDEEDVHVNGYYVGRRG